MFKLRASAGGKLATNPRSKSEILSETTKSYIQDWLKESIYGVKKSFSSKYTDKGNLLEDDGIDMVINHFDLPFCLKNEEHFEDDFFTGTPDLIANDIIFDVKCSWDCFTFPLFEVEIPNKDYFYQMQIYMHLTGLKNAHICYVLLNTPETLTFEEVHDYSNVDEKFKIKTFKVDYDENVIETLKERVIESRHYINQITK